MAHGHEQPDLAGRTTQVILLRIAGAAEVLGGVLSAFVAWAHFEPHAVASRVVRTPVTG